MKLGVLVAGSSQGLIQDFEVGGGERKKGCGFCVCRSRGVWGHAPPGKF